MIMICDHFANHAPLMSNYTLGYFPVEGAINSESSWPRNVILSSRDFGMNIWIFPLKNGYKGNKITSKIPFFAGVEIRSLIEHPTFKQRSRSDYRSLIFGIMQCTALWFWHGFGKAMWSAIISRSLTKNMIYDHSRSWSPKSQKYDLKSIMIVIWSEMIGDHEDLDLALNTILYYQKSWNQITFTNKSLQKSAMPIWRDNAQFDWVDSKVL